VNTSTAATVLQDIGILVTRPPDQAQDLIQTLASLGARPIAFPALAILPPRDADALDRVLAGLADFQLAIFISPSAVEKGMAAVRARGSWPPQLAVACVGQGTAGALAACGIRDVLVPDAGADSTHLLAMPRLQDVDGQAVILFRGEGGSPRLADTLDARGAHVTHAVCYRRDLPAEADAAPVLAAFAAGRIQAVTAYSGETLDNLFHLLGPAGAEFLRRTPLFVPHPRIASHAATRGVQNILSSPDGETRLILSLVEYFSHA